LVAGATVFAAAVCASAGAAVSASAETPARIDVRIKFPLNPNGNELRVNESAPLQKN
jgi:hypothetical protein